MAQTALIIKALKKALKQHGKTYADVADYLQLSEASIKRMFAQNSVTLLRLDTICQMLEMEISDLVQQANSDVVQHISELSDADEKALVADVEMLLVTVCVIHCWTLEDILQFYNIPEARCIQILARLDRMKIIDLLPYNKIKVKVSPNFKWRENGPLHKFFQDNVEAEFFNTRFDLPQEQLIVLNGMLSDESNAIFRRKLERLAREFDEMTKEDNSLPLNSRKGYTAVLAVRNWHYEMFRHLRK